MESYQVHRIEEDVDFGCEERAQGSPVLALVTLRDENGFEKRLLVPDQLLYDRDINEGDFAVLDENGELWKKEEKWQDI
ncbi:MAG: hypothetical protein Q4E89_11495 [Eubacteriales bacterium]|nr:hypothetical protein [Eubacteriales bacterium]